VTGLLCLLCSVVDPHHLDADPDSEFLFDADPEADPDPTFHPDADLDHSVRKRLKPLKKG
jgi:hypothetical protein